MGQLIFAVIDNSIRETGIDDERDGLGLTSSPITCWLEVVSAVRLLAAAFSVIRSVSLTELSRLEIEDFSTFKDIVASVTSLTGGAGPTAPSADKTTDRELAFEAVSE